MWYNVTKSHQFAVNCFLFLIDFAPGNLRMQRDSTKEVAMRIERVSLGHGYLHMYDSDSETLYLAGGPGKRAFIPGIHVPIGAIEAYGELLAISVVSRKDYLAGERIALGEGVIRPYERGIRIRARENTFRSALNTAQINRLIRAEIPVNIIFNAEL